MPCGGIYPVSGICDEGDHLRYTCLFCGKNKCDHWCEEWDAPLHADCIVPFLETEEGQTVLHHGHLVQRGDEILHEGT